HDRTTHETRRISVGPHGGEGDGDSFTTSNGNISADGKWVGFTSYSTNFIAGDDNASVDAFVYSMERGVSYPVSLDGLGGTGDGDSLVMNLSGDGRYAAIATWSGNLAAGDTNKTQDVFVVDLSNLARSDAGLT